MLADLDGAYAFGADFALAIYSECHTFIFKDCLFFLSVSLKSGLDCFFFVVFFLNVPYIFQKVPYLSRPIMYIENGLR